MDSFRKVRRATNARLAKALRKGRLKEELAAMEREGVAWLKETPKAAHRTGRRSRQSLPKRKPRTA